MLRGPLLVADGGIPASLRYAETVRALGPAVRRYDLVMPSFRSPPRAAGVMRSLRRRRDDRAVVAVRLADRPWGDVLADMVDGVLAANGLDPASGRGSEVRAALLAYLAGAS